MRKSMHPGLTDNANHLFELKCPSFIRIIRAFQWENSFRFPQGSRVFYSADLDLINTCNIMTHDLTPVNKCSCSIIDFVLLHFLPAVRLSPVWSFSPVSIFVPHLSNSMLWTENLMYCWTCFYLHDLIPQNGTQHCLATPLWFFLRKMSSATGDAYLIPFVLASSLPHLFLHLLLSWENRNHLMSLPHFSKTTSPLPFFFSHTLLTIRNVPWGQNLAQCLAHGGLPRLMMNKWILHPFLIYQVTLLCLHTTSWRGERKSPSHWLKHLG